MLQIIALLPLENKWQIRASSLPRPFWLTSTPPALVLSFFGCKMGTVYLGHQVAVIFGAPGFTGGSQRPLQCGGGDSRQPLGILPGLCQSSSAFLRLHTKISRINFCLN